MRIVPDRPAVGHAARGWLLAAALLAACPVLAGEPEATEEPIQALVIPATTPFAPTAFITDAIRSECTVPAALSGHLRAAAARRGISWHAPDAPALPPDMPVLSLRITDARARGNAFAGVLIDFSVSGSLRRQDLELGSFVAYRTCNSLMMRSTCQALYDCAETVANDIATWLQAPRKNARLGKAP